MESTSPLGDATLAADLLDDDEADPQWSDDGTLPEDRFLDRELSWLAFNQRVLELAEDDSLPILERANFLAIFASNLDEFFEVRYADVLEASRTRGTGIGPQYIADVAREAHQLVDDQYRIFNDVVGPALREAGIHILNHAHRNEAQREWVANFFRKQVQPLLTPIGLDPSHPFPQVANKTLNFIVQLGGMDAFGRDNDIAIVRIIGIGRGLEPLSSMLTMRRTRRPSALAYISARAWALPSAPRRASS